MFRRGRRINSRHKPNDAIKHNGPTILASSLSNIAQSWTPLTLSEVLQGPESSLFSRLFSEADSQCSNFSNFRARNTPPPSPQAMPAPLGEKWKPDVLPPRFVGIQCLQSGDYKIHDYPAPPVPRTYASSGRAIRPERRDQSRERCGQRSSRQRQRRGIRGGLGLHPHEQELAAQASRARHVVQARAPLQEEPLSDGHLAGLRQRPRRVGDPGDLS